MWNIKKENMNNKRSLGEKVSIRGVSVDHREGNVIKCFIKVDGNIIMKPIASCN